MVSSATTRNRLEKIGPGEQLNSWGGPNGLNRVIDLIDALADGWVTVSSTSTLTSSNYIADQARMRCIKYTGSTPGTITIPSVEKWYWVWAVSYNVTVTTGGGATATVKAGNIASIHCDSANCYKGQDADFGGSEVTNIGSPTSNSSAATKAYVDGQAFGSTNLPGISASTSGQVVRNNGSTAYWDFDGFEGRTAYSGNHTVAFSERQMLLAASTALTFTMDAATTLKNKYIVRLTNETTSSFVTVATTGSDTINGAASISLAPGETVDVTGDGNSAFIAKYVTRNNVGPHVIVQERRTSGTAADTLAVGANTRTLNTTVRNVIGASVASNRVTLPAGTWRIWGGAPAFALGALGTHRAYVYNFTDSAIAILGTSEGANGASISNVSTFDDVITITSSKAFEVRQYASQTGAGGVPASSGDQEVYTRFYATRIG